MTFALIFLYTQKQIVNIWEEEMKRYIYALLSLVLAIALTGCNSDNKQKANIEENTTAIEQNLTLPTCSIEQGIPTTESMFTVHVRCKDGNIPIDEATVTVDSTVKSVEYKGTGFSDYIGFRNLQPNRSYKATLEVIVGGERIEKSVKVRTKEKRIDPIPPIWRKSFYDTGLLITEETKNNIILDLKNEVVVQSGQALNFKIKTIKLESYEENPNIAYKGLVEIEKGVLKFTGYNMGTGSKETAIVTISAISNNVSSDTKVKFDFLLPIL